MKTDRELLELAARAAGRIYVDGASWDEGAGWNPLEDDGESLRLAVMLRLDIEFIEECDTVYVSSVKGDIVVTAAIGDLELRRAIVRAAAAIGESM